MNSFQVIPIILQFQTNLSSFTIGIGVINNPATSSASALFHLGYCQESGLSFDLFYLQGLMDKYSD